MREPTVRVFADSVALTRAITEQCAEAVEQATRQRERFIAALAGGGTPQAVYELLAAPTYRVKLPWAQMHFFWGDERVRAAGSP